LSTFGLGNNFAAVNMSRVSRDGLRCNMVDGPVGGIDCIGLGTDFDGFTDPPDDLKDHSRIPDVIHVMQENGFTPAEVEKVVGGNARRVLNDGWGR
jgi:membrane dipeptidase